MFQTNNHITMVKTTIFPWKPWPPHRHQDALLRPTLVVPELGGQGLGSWFLWVLRWSVGNQTWYIIRMVSWYIYAKHCGINRWPGLA